MTLQTDKAPMAISLGALRGAYGESSAAIVTVTISSDRGGSGTALEPAAHDTRGEHEMCFMKSKNTAKVHVEGGCASSRLLCEPRIYRDIKAALARGGKPCHYCFARLADEQEPPSAGKVVPIGRLA